MMETQFRELKSLQRAPVRLAFVNAADRSGQKGIGSMQNDLDTRERKTGSAHAVAASSVKSKDDEIHHVLERAVVGACFKGTIPGKDGDAQSKPCEDPQPCENDAQASVRHHRKLPSINGAGCGTAAMAGMKRFIAVMDKVYSKVLTDGDFDFIGFMTARGLSAEEMLDLLEACAARLGADWNCVRAGSSTSRWPCRGCSGS
jgi:hypothetical protein